MRPHFLTVAAIVLSAAPALATSDGDLRTALEQRFKGDRTGACVAAAVIDNGTTATAYVCADAKTARPFDDHTAFEIGSVTKTMTAALLAELIARGEVTLNDPIAKLLPAGTTVPSFNGRQITIGDIVTHTSGLPRSPPQWHMADMNNPFAGLTEHDLLGALAATQLTRAPGSQWEYSNFAMMVLSYALAKRSGKNYETLLRERLLAPLGMSDTYIAKRPPQVHLAQGHLANARPAVPWDFPVDMAGVGGAHATLPDMVRYLEGELGTRASAITPVLAQTQVQVATVGGHTMAVVSSIANGHHRRTRRHRRLLLRRLRSCGKRAVVLLSDTALTSVAGWHDRPSSAIFGARRCRTSRRPTLLIDALVGRYRLQSGLPWSCHRATR
jgi:CubicO group peptidase (beta-lactamase class C family)